GQAADARQRGLVLHSPIAQHIAPATSRRYALDARLLIMHMAQLRRTCSFGRFLCRSRRCVTLSRAGGGEAHVIAREHAFSQELSPRDGPSAQRPRSYPCVLSCPVSRFQRCAVDASRHRSRSAPCAREAEWPWAHPLAVQDQGSFCRWPSWCAFRLAHRSPCHAPCSLRQLDLSQVAEVPCSLRMG